MSVREISIEYAAGMSKLEYQRAYMRQYRPLKRLLGECAWCSAPRFPGKSLCRKHLDGVRARMAR